MADRSNSSGAHVAKTRPLSSSGRKSNIRSNMSRTGSGPVGTSRDLLSREEEYKRLNEELEAKTASLVKEAEQVMRDQESLLSKPSLLENINTDDFLKDYGVEDNLNEEDSETLPTRTPSSSSKKFTNENRPQSQTKKSASKKGTRTRSRNVQDVATVDDTFVTDFKDFSLQKTISNIEGQVDQGDYVDSEEDVLPQAAQDMGSEATIRFLKAKLRVMQEELDRLAEECNHKEEDNNSLHSKLKDLEDDRNRLQRTSAGQQTQIDKYKRLAEDAKGKSDSLENQLTGLRKELDQMKRTQKQQTTNQSAVEVRLNRALEEVEKYKSQVQKTKSQSKDSTDQEKRRVDQLMAENKRLEKQKNELMAGFKKQLKLIDILKRQKMHIEAAKMLSFSEEEFVKALEWGSN